MNDDEILSAYVGALKDAYETKMRLLDETFRMHSGPKAEAKWGMLAGLLLARQLDPAGYMQYVFDFCCEHLDGFYIPVVTSLKMVERYAARLPEHQKQLAKSVQYQIAHVNDRIGRGESLVDILTDANAPVNAAVRYAMACALQDPALAAEFKPEAKYLLVFEPHLKKLLGAWLPKEML